MSDILASRPFEARYHTTCAGCEEKISPGDLVKFVDDEVVHEDCEPREERPAKPPCPACFMVHAGECL